MNRTRLDPPRWDLAKASAFCHTACFEASREHPNSIFWTQLLPSDPAHECLVVDPALSILLSCSYRPLNVTPPRLLAKAGAPPAPTLTFSGALLTITYHECPSGFSKRFYSLKRQLQRFAHTVPRNTDQDALSVPPETLIQHPSRRVGFSAACINRC